MSDGDDGDDGDAADGGGAGGSGGPEPEDDSVHAFEGHTGECSAQGAAAGARLGVYA